MAILKNSKAMVDPTLWDKLKSWKSLKEDIERQLIDPGGVDPSITLEHGLQLMATLRHSNRIQAMTHFSSPSAEVFLTHYKMGSLNMNCSWDVLTRVSGEYNCTVKKFETQKILAGVVFIPEHRVYVAYCPDLQLQVFSDSKTRCEEKSTTTCITTLLCMTYNSDKDELITGGIGHLLRWNLHGIEKGFPIQPGKKFETSISPTDWVREVKVDERFKRIMALCGSNICIINYENDRETHFFESHHLGVPCCCSFYKLREYFLTASNDGCIKVWNACAIKQVHEFVGHYGRVTSLEIHKTEPLLLSSSLDSTVQVWRMDNFQWLKRLDVGEAIYSMKLLGRGVLFCQTLNNVLIYSLNQFYNMFSPVESTVHCLERVSWPGYASVIITSSEDGSVRFLNPVTGSTITIIFPLPTFHVFSRFAYNRRKNLLFTLTPEEAVLIFDCSSSPCLGVELRESNIEDPILSLALVTIQKWNGEVDDMLTFIGHANGEISLLDSSYHILNCPIKIHQSGVTCLESVAGDYRRGNGLVGRLLSAGSNKSIRVTDVIKKGGLVSFNPRATFRLQEIPLFLSMMGEFVCAVVTPHRVMMAEVDFTSKRTLNMDKSPLSHAINEDHTAPITGLDCCKALGLFITAGNDGYVKLWDTENVLVRELHFGDSLQGVCFANLRGDFLIGFQRHVCSVSVLRYLPVYLLEKLVNLEFEDDLRETPLSFDNKLRLSFEPRKLPTFSVNTDKRKSQIKNWSLSRSSDLQDLIKGRWRILDDVGRKCLSRQHRQIYVQDFNFFDDGDYLDVPNSPQDNFSPGVAFGLKRFADLMRIKRKNAQEEAQSFSGVPLEIDLSQEWRITLEEHIQHTQLKLEMAGHGLKVPPIVVKEDTPEVQEEIETFRGQAFGETSRRSMADWIELERMYSKWTIAPDGYIPNSVVRKRLEGEFGRPEIDKPQSIVIRKRYQGKLPRKRRLVPIPTGSRPPSRRRTKTPETEMMGRVMITPTPTSPKMKMLQGFLKPKFDMTGKKQPENKLLQLASLQPFDFSAIEMPEEKQHLRKDKEEKKTFIEEIKVAGGMVFSRIVKEKWFPNHINFQKGAIITALLDLLQSQDPIINKHVSKYMIDLAHTHSIPKYQQIDFIKALLEQLKSSDHGIQKESIWCLGELGLDHEEIILALIPKLVAEDPMIREETTKAIQKILGVNNKDDLLIALEKRGYVTGFSDQVQSEDEVFSKLKQNKEEILSPVAQTRVMGWLQNTPFAAGRNTADTEQPEVVQPMMDFTRTVQLPRHPKKSKRDDAPGPYRKRGANAKKAKEEVEASDISQEPPEYTSERRSSVSGRRGSVTKSGRRGSITVPVRRGNLASSKRRGSLVSGEEEPTDLDDMEKIAEDTSSKGSLSISDGKGSQGDLSDMDEAEEDSDLEGRSTQHKSRVKWTPSQEKMGSRAEEGWRKVRRRKFSIAQQQSLVAPSDSFESLGSADNELSEFDSYESSPFVNMDDGLEDEEDWTPEDEVLGEHSSFSDAEGYPTVSSEALDSFKQSEMSRRGTSSDKRSTERSRKTASRSTQGSKGATSHTPGTTRGTPAASLGMGGLGIDQKALASASVGTMLFGDQAGRIEPKRGRGVLLFDQEQLNKLQRDTSSPSDKIKVSPEEVESVKFVTPEKLQKDSLGLGVTEPQIDEKERIRLAEERARLLSSKDWSEEKSTPERTSTVSTEPLDRSATPSKESMDSTKQTQGRTMPVGKLKFEEGQRKSIIYSDDSAILSHESQDRFSEGLSQQLSGNDEISVIDSGISQDTSSDSFRATRPYGVLFDPSLSPVKSLADTIEEQEAITENWRDFFNRSSAQERKRLELVKRDFIQGKTKPLTVVLPPISYVKDNVQLHPGNSGFRLLHSVSIGEKEKVPDRGKHRIEPIPAKLGMDTKSESQGSSKFGILKMKWTTSVPVYFGQEVESGVKKQTLSPAASSIILSALPPIEDRAIGRLEGKNVFGRMGVGSGEQRVYKWETPLPPAPRLSFNHLKSAKKNHEHYCKYYSLAKKNMQKYTSTLLSPVRSRNKVTHKKTTHL